MTAEIKGIFQAILQDPELKAENNNRNDIAWEAAWKRYRQTKRNEKALTLVKHEKPKFHAHSKFGKILKPITYEEKTSLNKQDYLMTGEKEGFPKWPKKIGTPSKFPPEQKNEFVEYVYEETNSKRELPPQTALERLKKTNENKKE